MYLEIQKYIEKVRRDKHELQNSEASRERRREIHWEELWGRLQLDLYFISLKVSEANIIERQTLLIFVGG